jgi:hypothetical protein
VKHLAESQFVAFYRKFLQSKYFLLVELSLGLILPPSKTEKNPVFCIQLKFYTIFSVKQKNFLHILFGADRWQDLCIF